MQEQHLETVVQIGREQTQTQAQLSPDSLVVFDQTKNQ